MKENLDNNKNLERRETRQNASIRNCHAQMEIQIIAFLKDNQISEDRVRHRTTYREEMNQLDTELAQ